MIDHAHDVAAQSTLQERLRQLEQENTRLSEQLEHQKEVMAALLENPSSVRRAIEHAAIAYSRTNLEGRFVDANPAYCRLTGYSLEELQQLRLSDLIHPDDYEANMRLIQQQIAREIPPFVIENRYVRKDGQAVWVRKSVAAILGPDEKPQWILSLVEDTTEKKQAERELQDSERIYRAIGEAIPYGVWICDPTGRNIYASQSYLDLVGITQEQCSEFGWGDTLHPNDAERTIAAWKECVRTEGVWDIEHRFRGTDGKYHPILARGVPVRDDSGEIICWAGINLDISNFKTVQEALRLTEHRFKVALDNSPIIVYTTDCDLRYTWIFNPAFGMKPADLIGRTDEELWDPEDVAALVEVERSVLATGIWRREEVVRRHAGQEYSFDVTVEPTRDERGVITGLTVAAVDITENKRREARAAEAQVRIERQRRLLEQREEERMTLARDLHDGPIQTLAATLMDLQMIRGAFDDRSLQVELSRIDRHLRDAGHELRDIVSELRPSVLHTLGLSQAVAAHGEEFRKKYPDLVLIQSLAKGDDRLSRYTSLSLFRIYQEALNNVARHAQAGEVNVRLSFTSDCTRLEIRDNGRGMESIPDLNQLTTQGHYGLAGMKERAEAVNGEFHIASVPGKGTTVIVTVPVESDV